MLNTDFGLINQILGGSVPWLENAWLARFSILAVNLWAGFPYFFLVCSGALTAIPADLKEAAFVDGASSRHAFRTVVLPLLLVATAPLLVTTFAFNFNNFTLIQLLTDGGPFPGVGARRRLHRPDDQLHLSHRLQRRQPAARARLRHRDADLRDRRDDIRLRLPADPATRGDRPMSTTTETRTPAAPATAAPIKADKMPFGRWFRVVGWRHIVAVVMVIWALFPAFYVISLALSGSNTLTGACPPTKSGLAALTLPHPDQVRPVELHQPAGQRSVPVPEVDPQLA